MRISEPDKTTALYEQLAKIGNALASPQRLRLINILSQCERTVEGLAEAVGLPVGNVSHHLQRLSRVQLVTARKVGRHVIYSMADSEVTAFWLNYRDFCSGRLAELQLMRSSLDAERNMRGVVDQESLDELLKQNTVTLLDVRPREEFEAGHLPGAVSCPIDQLTRSIKRLPVDKTIILYCRGPLCLLADQAHEILAARGIKALQFTDGAVEWASAGRSVNRSSNYEPNFASD